MFKFPARVAGVLFGLAAVPACALGQGSQDLSFAVNGLARVGVPSTNERWNDIKVQPDGKIVVAGATNTGFFGGPGACVVARYLPSGVLDTTFNGSGSITVGIQSAKSVVIEPDGQILVAGDGSVATLTIPGVVISQAPGIAADINVARLNANGTLDTTFGVNGIVRTDLSGNRVDTAERIVLFPDGRFWVVGAASSARGETITNWAITAYNANGSLNTAFGTGGRTQIDFGQTDLSASAFDAVIQGNGVVIVGTSGLSQIAAKVNAVTGLPDPSFGVGGIAEIPLDTSLPSTSARATSVVVQPDGKLFINGNRTFFDSDPGEVSSSFTTATRLTPGGAVDPTFNAFPQFAFISSPTSAARIVNGRVVLNVTGSYLVRLNANGSIETTFGEGGILRPQTSNLINIDNLAVQADGRLLMAGAVFSNLQVDAALIRITLPAVPPPVPCPEDLTGDGAVNTADLVEFLGRFGQTVTPGSAGDLTGDGQVNTADLTQFLGRFGQSCG
jgi:uncharacterized delta-60 repeat protein